MRKVMQCGMLVAMFIACSATVGQVPAAKVTPRAAPQTPAVTARPASARLGAADEAKLKAMVAQQQRVRSQLPAESQTELDQLTAQVRKQLFAAPLRADLVASAAQIVIRMIPSLTTPEAASLAEYVLGGIAGGGATGAAAEGSAQAGLMNAASSMQETQMGFNLQYLQLQSQMQDENRSYTTISNILKTKHDTVKNSIGNIR